MRPDTRSLCHVTLVGVLVCAACVRPDGHERELDSLRVVLASTVPLATAAPTEETVPPAAIRAALDSVYRVMQQASRARDAAAGELGDTIAMLRNRTSRLALAVEALRDSLGAMLQRNASVGDVRRGQELALDAARHAEALDRLNGLLAERTARVDTLAAEATALRDSLAAARGSSEAMSQQMEALSAELATARELVASLQSDVARLSGAVERMEGESHLATVCIGTGEELERLGIAERRGGVRGAFAAWTIRRGARFDDCRDRFDWRDQSTVILPGVRRARDAERFEVLSAHDPSLVVAEALDEPRRYGLVIRSPERFWAAGPVLVIRLR